MVKWIFFFLSAHSERVGLYELRVPANNDYGRLKSNLPSLTGDARAARYSTDRMIGRGGYGEVWHALVLDRVAGLNIGEPVVMKKIPLTGKHHKVESGKREVYFARLCRQHGVPHIPRFYDWFVADGHMWMVSEHRGENLLRLLFLGAEPTTAWVQLTSDTDRLLTFLRQLLIEVGQTLEGLDRLNVVHRDIKLSNLLVNNGSFSVIDFGSGIQYPAGDPTMFVDHFYQYESPSAAQETAGYQPPLFGRSPCDGPDDDFMRKHPYDVWGLAVVVLQILAGQLDPFMSSNPRQVLRQYPCLMQEPHKIFFLDAGLYEPTHQDPPGIPVPYFRRELHWDVPASLYPALAMDLLPGSPVAEVAPLSFDTGTCGVADKYRHRKWKFLQSLRSQGVTLWNEGDHRATLLMDLLFHMLLVNDTDRISSSKALLHHPFLL
ncbi:MAG: uncharacterized protein KVP18_000799 [Porospora cf. gigantea A]|uniref:uncharacterized protein n=1 Tax=Porospora cf. gigantea A TaxID=2853593 RepID=UPI0035597603|nr:MAG: hypothetical protein KVP18_000799 [Porospora cf. gigantea A]